MNHILDFLDRMEEEIGYGCRIAVGKYPENTELLVFRVEWPNEIVMQFLIPRNEIRNMADENAMDSIIIDGAITAYKSHL